MYFKAGASAEGGIDEGHENKAICIQFQRNLS